MLTAAAAGCLLGAGGGTGEDHRANPNNHLGGETSPYLLQHADNPVNWYPWGPEAFEAAREQNKPIFLSIGYSTCYWCHVMERESFENEQIAALLNEHFISIKVDREERPDLDDIYMAAVQQIAGRGGWPMSVFLEPGRLRPFEGGTYFPARSRGGRRSFPELLESVNERWREDPDAVVDAAARLAGQISTRLAASRTPVAVGREQVDRAVAALMSTYDPGYGGFGRGNMKFPLPSRLELLVGAAWDDPNVREAVMHTLDRMAMGGIYDQLGGGFHRYSTDAAWLIPHFEKMLYDNGQLVSVYAKVYALTGDPFYGGVVRQTLDCVLREMTSPQGAFYSARDAEVNGREGAGHVWTPDEVRTALEACWLADETSFAFDLYGLRGRGNFQDPHHPEEGVKFVLRLGERPEHWAAAHDMTLDEYRRRIVAVRECLLDARRERGQPATDDKVLTGWNGLMITGMVEGARALGDPWYLANAERAATFVLENMRAEDGGLYRSYRDGRARIDALSRDYAMFIAALIALHRGGVELRGHEGAGGWLRFAAELAGIAKTRFWDGGRGGYYDTRDAQADLFVRTRLQRDGVIPCADSLMLSNLLDLYALTGDAEFLEDAEGTLAGLSSRIHGVTNVPLATLGLHRFLERHSDRVDALADVAKPRDAKGAGAVRVGVTEEPVRVSSTSPGRFDVTLTLRDGYHVNAHEPGASGLVGLGLQLVGRGFELEPAYPAGEPFRIQGLEGQILVHTGEVVLPVIIRQTVATPRAPRIVLNYQVCTDRYCLEPVMTILPVEIETGP